MSLYFQGETMENEYVREVNIYPQLCIQLYLDSLLNKRKMIQWAWDDIFTPFIALSSRLATAVWHDLSKFRHNGNILKSLWQFLGERIWYNFETMWQKYNTTGPIFLVVSEWQNVIIAIWSHCLVDDGVIWLISLI